jgi:hypothetical protein
VPGAAERDAADEGADEASALRLEAIRRAGGSHAAVRA